MGRVVLTFWAAFWLAGCALAPPPVVEIPALAIASPAARAPEPEPRGGAPTPQELPGPVNANRVFRTADGRPRYLLGPGDSVELIALGEPDPKPLTLNVDEIGDLVVPNLGRVPVAGSTLTEAEAETTARLIPVLQDPRVSLRLLAPAAHRVFLRAGTASKTVALTGRTTLAEFLATNYQGPDEGQVRLRRGTRGWTFGLPSALSGEAPGELVLDEGDVVAVEAAKPGRIFVIGEVARQGGYPLEGPTDSLKAVTLAGGFAPGARRQSAALLRAGLSGPRVLAAPLGPGGLLLADGDIVYVGRSGFGDWNAFLEQLRPTLDFLSISRGTAANLQNVTW